MLTGSAPDAATLDRALMIAKQFGADVINSVKVSSPQQVMLEVRFIEVKGRAGLGDRKDGWRRIDACGRASHPSHDSRGAF